MAPSLRPHASDAIGIADLDSWPQRRHVLAVLSLTARDVPCVAALLLMLGTVWRVPLVRARLSRWRGEAAADRREVGEHSDAARSAHTGAL